MSKRKLPPLLTDTNYEAADFEQFEYLGAAITGSKAILRLHLRNGTTIDLPATDAQLKQLLAVMIQAFGPDAIAYLKSLNWIPQ